MIAEAAFTDVFAMYPVLRELDAEERASLLAAADAFEAPAGATLFEAGQACNAAVLLFGGAVRVIQRNGEREMLLYRVAPGEMCILALACALSGRAYPAWALAEGGARGVAVPAELFGALLDRHPQLRRELLRDYSRRVVDMVAGMGELAFCRVEQRLARRLLELGTAIRKTHQELADELGTAREVVSRTLKQFESNGVVTLRRGEIHIESEERLRGLVGEWGAA